MNKHWCEGLDWVRVEDIIDVAPELYIRLLANRMHSLEYAEDGYEDAFHAELRRRAQKADDVLRNCFVEALRVCAQEDKQSLDQTVKLLRQNYGQHVVRTPDGFRIVELKVVSNDEASS